MRCNRHVSDYSSTVGVCASCLRERLFTLIAAQVEENRRKTEDRRKASADAHHPPPLVFPRSVSPYICRRSDDSSWHNNDRRFYSTPQLGPTYGASSLPAKKKRSGKFSLFSTLFRSSRSQHPEGFSDPRVSTGSLASSNSNSNSSPMSSSSSSSSWFSSLLSGRRNKTSRFNEALPPVRHRRTHRGMSPANAERDFDLDDGSGHSSESSPGMRKSAPASVPASVPSARRRGSNMNNRNVTGMAFCLSPLVRANPNNHWCQKDVNAPAGGIPGEIVRKPTQKHHHLSGAASLCANRSRKLADIGRYSHR